MYTQGSHFKIQGSRRPWNHPVNSIQAPRRSGCSRMADSVSCGLALPLAARRSECSRWPRSDYAAPPTMREFSRRPHIVEHPSFRLILIERKEECDRVVPEPPFRAMNESCAFVKQGTVLARHCHPASRRGIPSAAYTADRRDHDLERRSPAGHPEGGRYRATKDGGTSCARCRYAHMTQTAPPPKDFRG